MFLAKKKKSDRHSKSFSLILRKHFRGGRGLSLNPFPDYGLDTYCDDVFCILFFLGADDKFDSRNRGIPDYP